MIKYVNRVLFLLLLLMIVGLTLSTSRTARAYSTPSCPNTQNPAEPVPAPDRQQSLIGLSLAQSGSFSDALDALAAQGHVAFVAEGVPLVPHLPKKEAQKLTAPVPLSEAVTKVAASFDYDVQKQGGVFILTKRYTNPKEMPCVTLEECRQAFSDILAVLDRYDPDFDEASDVHSQRSTVISFFASLSPEQLQEAQTKTLHYGELGPEQQGMVQSLFLGNLMQLSTYKLREAIDMLGYAPKSVLTGKDQGQTALFIQMPVPANKALRYYRPLEGGINPSNSAPSLILPKQAAEGASATPAPTTLATAVGLLAHTGPAPSVDAALKDKPVSVAGLKNVPSSEILRALKVLYSLRISVSEAGGEELARQILPSPDSLRNIGPVVWSILPVSIVRAIHLKNGSTGQPTPTGGGQAGSPSESTRRSQAEADQRLLQQMQSQTFLSELWSEAVQQVLVGVQPQLRRGGVGVHVPVRTLSSTTRSALAVALSVGALEDLQSAFTGQAYQNTMDCLDDMNSILVYTIPGEAAVIRGRTVPSIYFEGTNPYTKQRIGLGGARFSTSR
jgi:hypothetical protein